ncbi:hypothetical protein ACVGVM_21195 [Pseudonocardia bannensis]|uniref:Uncharacterized protein n=1 Tax=Pseudonocardia bannensis TaxID=630973 RepID=A0A848DF39_9PSEU|nr:hypothetical protein [Pseudonocardia bannensis]NMH91161.1 hypothetical protein [Pseudonocardia bannensis]
MSGAHHTVRRGPGRAVLAAVGTVAATAAVIGVFYGAGRVAGVPFEVFSKEPVDVLSAPRYTGWFAHLVVLVWQVAATAALVGALVLRRGGHREAAMFLGSGGVLTGVMVVDDFFLLHEAVYPKLGVPEEAVYVLYAMGAAAFVWRFRGRLGSDVVLLVAAYAFWGVSVGLDVLYSFGGPLALLPEDGTKATGTALWAVLMVRLTLAELDAVLQGRRGATHPPAGREVVGRDVATS